MSKAAIAESPLAPVNLISAFLYVRVSSSAPVFPKDALRRIVNTLFGPFITVELSIMAMAVESFFSVKNFPLYPVQVPSLAVHFRPGLVSPVSNASWIFLGALDGSTNLMSYLARAAG